MRDSSENAILAQSLTDAQQAVLGSMLLEPNVIGGVLQRVSEDDFVSSVYKLIFRTIRDLFSAGKPIDPIIVRGVMGNEYEATLCQLVEINPTAANVDVYTDLLKESAALYRLQALGTELATAETLDDAQALLDKAMQTRVSKPGVQRMSYAQGFKQFFDRHDGEKKPEYISWGVPVLDDHIFAEPGDMIVLGGYPSDGKTALALQFATGIGKKHKVGFYSFESTREKLYDRHTANAAMLSYTRIKRNELREEDYKDLMQLQDKLAGPQVDLIDAAGMTVYDIQSDAQAHHYDVIFVDYLQKCAVPPELRRNSTFDQVTNTSSSLQQFGRSTKTTVIALSQLSRPEKSWGGEVKPPAMQNLRSSGQIEQDADVILFVYREDYEDKESNRILLIAKNKEGEALDKVRFSFNGDTQTFTRIAPIPGEEDTEKPRREPQKYEQTSISEVCHRPMDDQVFPDDKET